MNSLSDLFHALCFSDKPLPWYLSVLKYVLYAILVVVSECQHYIYRIKRAFTNESDS